YQTLRIPGWRHSPHAVLLTLTFFIFLSIIATGAQYAHYMMQLLPFGVLPAGWFIHQTLHNARRSYAALLAILLGAAIGHNLTAALPFYRNRDAYDHPFYRIADYLKAKQVQGQYIFCTDSPLPYFLTGALPPMPNIHPYTYSRLYLPQALYGKDYTQDRMA